MGNENIRGCSAANLWCWAVLIILSALALVIAPAWLTFNRFRGWSWTRGAREGTWIYGRFYLAAIRPFVKVTIIGQLSSLNPAPGVMVVNHQSWLDIYLLGAQKERNLCFLVRGWPFRRLFFFRPLMRLSGYIETEGVEAEEILRQCRREIQSGSIIVCFPEGTRSRDGSLGRFRSGVFKLAAELDIPMIPLIIHHSGRVMPKGSLVFRPGVIRMEIGRPAEPGHFRAEAIAHGAMRRFVRHRFISALELNPSPDGSDETNHSLP